MSENIFSSYAHDRKEDQEKIEKAVAPKDPSERIHVTMTMTVERKKKLKMYAIKRGMTVSGVVEEWIDKYAD